MGDLPGQHRRSFRVTVSVATGAEVKDDSGMPLTGFQLRDLLEQVAYAGDLERLDGRWTLVLQWVDLDNDGHRILIPHEVVERVLAHADKIMATARSERPIRRFVREELKRLGRRKASGASTERGGHQGGAGRGQ